MTFAYVSLAIYFIIFPLYVHPTFPAFVDLFPNQFASIQAPDQIFLCLKLKKKKIRSFQKKTMPGGSYCTQGLLGPMFLKIFYRIWKIFEDLYRGRILGRNPDKSL